MFNIKINHGCIIDKEKNFIEFVQVIDGVVQGHTLSLGEKLVNTNYPSNLILPQWTGSEWKETATQEQVEEYQKNLYQEIGLLYPPSENPPSPSEQEQRLLEQDLALMELATMISETQKALMEQAGGEK